MSNETRPDNHQERLAILEFRQEQTERVLAELRDAAKGIERSLARIAAVEEKHSATTDRIDKLDERQRAIELRIALWSGGAVVASTAISLIAPVLLRGLGS